MTSEKQTIEPQNIEPLAVSVTTAAKLLSLSKSTFYGFLSSGKIGPMLIRLGDGNRAKPLFSLAELRDWIASQDPKTGTLPNREKWQVMKQEGQQR